MLKYRININQLDKSRVEIPVTYTKLTDLDILTDEEGNLIPNSGLNKDKILVTCECDDIDYLQEDSVITANNTLTLVDMGDFEFMDNFKVESMNEDNRSFSFYMDKYRTIEAESIIVMTTKDEKRKYKYIYLTTKEMVYFDAYDNLVYRETTNDEGEKTTSEVQEIPIYFKYTNTNGETVTKIISFQYESKYRLRTTGDYFEEADATDLYNIIFNGEIEDCPKGYFEGNLSGVTIHYENFLFGSKCEFFFDFERALVTIPLSLSNSFETNLHQSYLVEEDFVNEEEANAINSVVDLENDVYSPVMVQIDEDGKTIKTTDVYSICFNLHFREHRGDNWLVDGNSMWNGVVFNEEEKKYEIYKVNDKEITGDSVSDLLKYLDFNNNDIYYQKNKLKKSFLRLMFYDSTNPGDQNLVGYSTIFLNGGELFAKYSRHIETENYLFVKVDDDDYGKYSISDKEYQVFRDGIGVNREPAEITTEMDESGKEIKKLANITFDEGQRLSSQLVTKSKNLSTASSEGFYLYVWKANESAVPQDLYMKVEFNHAGYGRTLPFMMPYWDKKKWAEKEKRIKTFNEILCDWSDIKTVDEKGNVKWENGTDGHYGMTQYAKFSYIHLKYMYDKETNKHVYYLDPNTYGKSVVGTDNKITINLYEAKIG